MLRGKQGKDDVVTESKQVLETQGKDVSKSQQQQMCPSSRGSVMKKISVGRECFMFSGNHKVY